jgi:hypothetical protein
MRVLLICFVVLLVGVFTLYWYEDEVVGYPPPSQERAIRDQALVGTWKSNDDANFTRMFGADGTVTDAYAGDATATETGTYAVVDPRKEPADAVGVPISSLTGMTLLKLTFPKSGVMYFGVSNVTGNSLQLVYIGRGNTLSFTKVQ